MDEAAFVEYRPESVTWPDPEEFNVTYVPRDRAWFDRVRPELEAFFAEMRKVQKAALQAVESAVEEPVKKRARRGPSPVAYTLVHDLYD